MAAIGAIRKHGVLLMVIIGVALLAFILGDFTKVTTFFSNKYTMGKIDNKRIDKEYQEVFEQNSALFRLFYEKSSLEETETYQVHEMTWDEMVEEKTIDKELKKLGLSYSKEMIENVAAEILASLKTQQPDQLLARMFQMLATNYGADNAFQILANIEEYKNVEGAGEIYNAYKAIERFAVLERKKQSYYMLAQGSLYFSDNLAKQFANDNRSAEVELALINPSNKAFNNIAATVTDKEMKDWYKKHKARYENKRDARDIDVAIFPIVPTANDMKDIEDTVRSVYARFLAAPSIAEFNINEMLGQVDSTYYTADDVTLDVLDSLIFKRPVGTLIEPFSYENAVWYFGKTYGSAMRSDSLQISYLVLDYKNSQNPTATRTRKAAKKEADSLKAILKADPSRMSTILPNYMAGRNAADTTMWIEEKNTFRTLYDSLMILNNGGVYVNDAGGAYIVYQVIKRTEPKEKRQFALYPYEIKASDATVKSIRAKATELAGAATTADELVEKANKQGVQMVNGYNVTNMSASIGQLGNCRDIVSWAYNDETKVDNISDVYNINNQVFAVAALRSIKTKGIAKFDEVKKEIENELTTTKKIDMIAEKLNADVAAGKSMNDIAANCGSEVRDSITLGFGLEFYQNAQVENAAIGKIFTLKEGNMVNVVTGKQGLYLVNIHKFQNNKPTENLYMEKALLRNVVLGRTRNENIILDGLKDDMKTLDRRHYFYVK